MIKNILFDMGNVLIRFDRKLFLDRLEVSEADKNILLREVFANVEWAQMDRGTKTEETALESMRNRLPQRLHGAAETLTLHWDEPLIPIDGMYELVEELKEKGYGIYLLSNASYRQHAYWPGIAASRFFDGTLISADVHAVKPQPEIYNLCLEKFGLKAEESFFIDDVGANVEGAVNCGLQGAVFFGDVARLRRELRAAGVNVSE
jgi:putative hydrolase of the HAD superfamily